MTFGAAESAGWAQGGADGGASGAKDGPLACGLAVVNPGGSDPDQRFGDGDGGGDGAGSPASSGGHAPVNYHAYAACTGGSFHRDPGTIRPGQTAVLLLLRRDLKKALKVLAALKAAGKRVAVSLKESGVHQVAAMLDDAARLALFRQVCSGADFCLSSTPDLVPLYLGAGARRAEFVPTPYPVEVPAWDFSRPLAERRGILIGTREFDVPTRNHLGALLAAGTLGVPVTVVNPDGWRGRRKLEALAIPGLRVVEGRLGYAAYLELMASHRLVFQMDRSAVPGQVAGDALLCRMPCVGGDGAVERLAFPELSGFRADAPELAAHAARLMRDDAAWESAVADSQGRAAERLSFAAVAAQLAALYAEA